MAHAGQRSGLMFDIFRHFCSSEPAQVNVNMLETIWTVDTRPIDVWDSSREGAHLPALLPHLPVILLELVVEHLAARHQVLPADLAGPLLPHRLVALDVVLLLLLPVDGGAEGVRNGREKAPADGV